MAPTATHEYVRVLTIAGSDSGGGAGIQADLKTFAALGCWGMSAITALTAQNTLGVTAIHAAPPDFLAAQIDAVVSDMGVHAVKIGMLHSAEIVRVVSGAIDRHCLPHVVLDPVMVSATGAVLIERDAVQAVVQELFPRASVVTPNLDEAALLLGSQPQNAGQMHTATRALLEMGARAVLLKGAHLPGDEVVDWFWRQGDAQPALLRAPRVQTRNLHGAGCTLSAAIAAQLALGQTLSEAVRLSTAWVRQALAAGALARTGHGTGPLNHGFAPRPMALRPFAAAPASP
ncbi:MAG: bifunctional hydroxymethylpyrimidine kinase/phosphomethylpyrimidine kinase [Burkholderiaceae bacterium]|nr:bifunctional hydroxymethylpyrimidine kinase/phosphomethylpyrimidine kinase [Burkholderiaceae bacterium]